MKMKQRKIDIYRERKKGRKIDQQKAKERERQTD